MALSWRNRKGDEVSGELTEIAIILDRSGSMNNIREDMEGGLWNMLVEQDEQPGRCRASLYRFDNEFEVAFEGRPTGEIKQDDVALIPRGGTALNDAIVKAVALVEERISAEPEDQRPGKVVVVVITDGHENASRESKKSDAQNAIKRCETNGWQFVYLAADQQGFSEGTGLLSGAMPLTNVALYDAGDVKTMGVDFSCAVSDYRNDLVSSVNVSNICDTNDQD